MRLSFIVLAALLLAGCSLAAETRRIVVEIPVENSWEALGLEEPWHLIQWPDSRGSIRSLRLPPGVSRAEADLPKGADVPVLARPYGRYPGYGGWADAAESSRIVLSPQFSGFASLLLDLWQSVPERCAALRLSHWGEALDQLKDPADHPPADFQLLRLDRSQERISIITGELSAESLQLLPSAAGEVEFPEAGLWYLREDPCQRFVLPSKTGTLSLPYPGAYTFVHVKGGHEVTVVLDREGGTMLQTDRQ